VVDRGVASTFPVHQAVDVQLQCDIDVRRAVSLNEPRMALEG
jgi:hypothetical protein